MPTVPPKYSFSLDQFGDIPSGKIKSVGKDVAEFIKEEIYEYVGAGKSPVEGRGKFKQLTKDYADEFKGGNRKPNLELTAEMLDGLRVEADGTNIEIFISGDFENDKASGHNQFPGGEHDNLPVRRFIPGRGESFKKQIQAGIRRIVLDAQPEQRTNARDILADAFGEGADALERQLAGALTESQRSRDLTGRQITESERLARTILAGFGSGSGLG